VQAGWNFRVLLGYGTLFVVGLQLSNIETVIPYIAEQVGSPGLVVALLVPGFTAGTLLGTALGPKALHIAGSIAGLLAGIALFEGALTALIAVDIVVVPPQFVAYPMLLLCILIGIVSGSAQVGYPIATSALLSPRKRSDLFLRQDGFGAALATVMTVLFASQIVRDFIRWHDVYLLWIAVAAMALSAASSSGLRTRGVGWAASPDRMLDTLRSGHVYLRANRWMQRFLAIQLIFLSVTLSPMFYAIYAGRSSGPGSGDMDDFVVFFGIGLLAGIPLWTVVRLRLGARGMYACSAAISVAAATGCIVSQHWHLLPGLWTFGLALLLAAIASQALRPASYDWLFSYASAEQVAVLLSYSQIVTGLGIIGASFAFGVAAEHGPDLWPLGLLLVLTAAACLAAPRVPRIATR
jgi:hypothetical protein